MPINSEELKKYVQEDVKKYEGVRRPLHASLFERAIVTNLPPKMLHPNPEDEFTWKNVGPSDKVISKYVSSLSRGEKFKEPIMIEKMFPDGYTLVNGHHRWAAAMRVGTKMLWVRLVNLTHEADILRMLDSSNRSMRAAFDLDEVLLVTDEHMAAEPRPKFPHRLSPIGQLREGVPALFEELHRLGFDIWVYTKTFYSEEQIRKLFKAYGEGPDGCINGVGITGKAAGSKSAAAFTGKYTLTVHIDNEGMIFTKPKTKEYDSVDLNAKEYDWVLNVIKEIRSRCGND